MYIAEREREREIISNSLKLVCVSHTKKGEANTNIARGAIALSILRTCQAAEPLESTGS
jgi:hypothetical protein